MRRRALIEIDIYPQSNRIPTPKFHLPLGVAAGEMALFHEDLQRNCNVGALSICDIYRVNTSQERLIGLSQPVCLLRLGSNKL